MAVKARARAIVKRINEGEEVSTTLVHMSEIANILEARTTLETSLEIISALIGLPNFLVLEVSKESYESAIEQSRIYMVGLNDALASLIMIEAGISEIYSFDKDYDRIHALTRIDS